MDTKKVDIYYKPDGTVDGWGMPVEGVEVPAQDVVKVIEDLTKEPEKQN